MSFPFSDLESKNVQSLAKSRVEKKRGEEETFVPSLEVALLFLPAVLCWLCFAVSLHRLKKGGNFSLSHTHSPSAPEEGEKFTWHAD